MGGDPPLPDTKDVCVLCAGVTTLIYNGPHVEWLCSACGHQRRISKASVGVGTRSVSSRSGIKPRQRSRVLERWGSTCRACGRRPPDVLLQVDHILPAHVAAKYDIPEHIFNSDANLEPLCEECNLGKGAAVLGIGTIRLLLAAITEITEREADR